MLEQEEDGEEDRDTLSVESDGIDGVVGDVGGGGRVVLEVVVGVLTAFTLLLLCLFLGLLFAYSRRQKTGGGDSSSCRRSLNPFPAAAQVNMKDLLLTLSPSGHHGLASLAQQQQQQQPNTSSSSSGAPSASSSSSSSNNKANITPNPGYYSFAAPDAGEGPPLLLTRLQQEQEQEHQQEQKERLFLQQQQQRHFSEEARARWHSTGNVDGLFDLEDEVGAAMPPSIVVADLLEGGGGGGGGGFGGGAEYACVDVQVKKLRKKKPCSVDKNIFLHLHVGFWRPSSPGGRQHGPLPPRRPWSGRHLVHLRVQPGEPLLQRAAAAAAGTAAAAASAALRHPADDRQAVEAAAEAAELAEQGAAPAAAAATAAADAGIHRCRQREEPLRLRLGGRG